MTDIDFASLGEADIRVAGLSLWLRRREFPEAADYWDANWLQAVAYCRYPGASVWTTGPFLRTDEIERFLLACDQLSRTLSGEATLDCMEPYLRVRLTSTGHGHIAVSISLTPDNVLQRHEFQDEIDQSYLPAIQSSCRRLLQRFPITGPKPT